MEEKRATDLASLEALGGLDTAAALGILESNSWDLNRAIASLPQARDGASTSSRRLRRRGDGVSAADQAAIAAAMGGDDDDVRAPIPMKRQRLCESGSAAGGSGRRADYVAREPFRDFAREMDTRSRRGSARSRASESRAPVRNDLATLFAPPRELLFVGPFEQLLDAARSAGKWVLVNIQDASSFDSARLNRDTWKDDAVRALVRRSFVLWQPGHDSVGGAHYSQIYHPPTFPHIAVICPRSRSQMASYSNFVEPKTLVSSLGAFIEQHGNAMGGGAASGGGAAPARKKKRAGKSDDELAMEAAIRASLAEMGADEGDVVVDSDNVEDGGADEWSSADDGDESNGGEGAALGASAKASAAAASDATAAAAATEATARAALAPSTAAPLSVAPPDDAAADDVAAEGGEMTRVQIRAKLPSGGGAKRIVRELSDATKVAHLFGIVRREIAGGAAFDLMTGFPTHSLRESGKQTLADAGLRDAAVVVRWE